MSLAVLLLDLAGGLRPLERQSYDVGLGFSDRQPGDEVVVIAIDERSLSNIGRWPWPRRHHADLLEQLSAATAVGYTVLFLEPQEDHALSVLRDLAKQLSEQSETAAAEGAKNPVVESLRQVMTDLDGDSKLISAIEDSANVIVGLPFEFGEPRGRPSRRLPEFVRNSSVTKPATENAAPVSVKSVVVPWPAFGSAVAAIGHQVANVENDGIVRQEPLVVDYYEDYIPSMSLLLAARYLGLDRSEITLEKNMVMLGGLRLPTDSRLRMNTFYYRNKSGEPPFEVDSFFDVVNGNINTEKYRGKIVLVGATAHGLSPAENIPVSDGARTAPVIRLAHTVATILNQHGFLSPAWGLWLKIGAFLLMAGFLMYVLPRLSAVVGTAVSLLLFGVMMGSQLLAMSITGMWIKLALALVTLLVGYVVLTTTRYFGAERNKLRADRESGDNLRAIGLNFQEKGQLDQAFDALRRSGNDEPTLAALYNLALDFEAKRQFNKASSVYAHIREIETDYRDVSDRQRRVINLEQTVLLGSNSTDTSLLFDNDGNVPQPTLGRYTIEKEIGKGAMGTVYLGRDPNIDRTVAIKTLDLARNVDEAELQEVKSRFFREGQAAGRLRHPNIVTIYDAGEEKDLAYIAMEVLTGRNLIHYGKPENLLPVSEVMHIIGACADALHYAHSQNVVHRDIKPGNIMYETQTKIVKITDFGIARIMDASRTKTGTVMGTPSYMSPEQLAGQKVDGRSDLFSLGVTMYLLLAGRWPFRAESLTNLMYKIANESHPPLHRVREDLPAGEQISKSIIDRALAKDAEDRFQSGTEFLQAIEQWRIDAEMDTNNESVNH